MARQPRSPILRRSERSYLLVADSAAHAKAVMHWWSFDPRDWKVIAWGERIGGSYRRAFLAMPTGGVTEHHLNWFEIMLRPCVSGPISTSHPGLLLPRDPPNRRRRAEG